MTSFHASRHARLIFPDSDWEGAEVWVRRSVSVRQYLYGPPDDARHWWQRLFRWVSRRQENETQRWLEYFCTRLLVSWNLVDDDGHPIPPTYEGAQDVDIAFLNACAAAWGQSVGQVDSPLEQPSSNGVPELELDLSSYSRPN
jgi:hypothetical protein